MYTSFERSVNARKQLRGKDGRWIYEGGSVKWWDALKGAFQHGTVAGFNGDYVDVESAEGGMSKVHRTKITSISKKASLGGDAPESADQQESGPKDISNWTQGKSMGGSNGAKTYTDEDGNEYVVKFLKSDDHAKNEVLASRLYDLAGVPTPGQELISKNGKLGVASPLVPNSKGELSQHLDDKNLLDNLREGFATDAWLANWDVAGLTYDNVLADENGDAIRIDPGGALLFRAMGTPKGDAFGNSAGEWETLRTSAQGKTIFGGMTEQQASDSAKSLADISDEDIDSVVDSVDFDQATSDKLKATLKARRDDVLKRAGLSSTGGSTIAKADLETAESETPEEFAPITDPEALRTHLNDVGIQAYIDNAKVSENKVQQSGTKSQIGDVLVDTISPEDNSGVIVAKHSADSVTILRPDGTEKKKSTHSAYVDVYRPTQAVEPAQASETSTDAPASPFNIVPADQRGKSGDGYHESGPWGKYGASGVMIHAEDTDKYYIVQRGGMVSSNKGKWQLPGGAMEENENPYQGAARELIEETSFGEDNLKNLSHAGDVVFDNEKGWQYTNIAANIPNEIEIEVDPHESAGGEWVTADELIDMKNAGELVPAFANNLDKILDAFKKKDGSEEVVDIPEDEAEDVNLPAPASAVQNIGGKGVKGIATADKGQGVTTEDHSDVSLSGVEKGNKTTDPTDIQSANIGQKVYDPNEPATEWERTGVDAWVDQNGMQYTSKEMQALATNGGLHWGSKEDYDAVNPTEPDEEPQGTIPNPKPEYSWDEVDNLVKDFYKNVKEGDMDDVTFYNLTDGTKLLFTKSGGVDDGVEVLPAGAEHKNENWLSMSWEDALRGSPSENIENLIFGGSANEPTQTPRISMGKDDLDSLPTGSVVKFDDASDSQVYLKNEDGTWKASWLDDNHPQKNVTPEQIHAVAAYLGKDVQVMKEDGEDNEPEEELAEWEKELLEGTKEDETPKPESKENYDKYTPEQLDIREDNLTEKYSQMPVGTEVHFTDGYVYTKEADGVWGAPNKNKQSDAGLEGFYYAHQIKEVRQPRADVPSVSGLVEHPVENFNEDGLDQQFKNLPIGSEVVFHPANGEYVLFYKNTNGKWSNGEETYTATDEELAGHYYANEIDSVKVPSDFKPETPTASEPEPEDTTIAEESDNLLQKLINLGDTPDAAKTVDGINYDSQGNAWVPDKNGKALRVGSIVTAKSGEKGKIDFIQKGGKKVRVKTEDGNTKFWNAHLVEKADPSVTFDDSNNKYAIQTDENGVNYLNSPDGDRIYVGDTVVSSGKTGFEGKVTGFKNGEFVLVEDPSDGKTKPRKIDKIKLVSSANPQAPTQEEAKQDVDIVGGELVPSVDALHAAPVGTQITWADEEGGSYYTKQEDGDWSYTSTFMSSTASTNPSSDFASLIESKDMVWKTNVPESSSDTYAVGAKANSADLEGAPNGTALKVNGNPNTFIKTESGKWAITQQFGGHAGNMDSHIIGLVLDTQGGTWAENPDKTPDTPDTPETIHEPGSPVDNFPDLVSAPRGAKIKNVNNPDFAYEKREDGEWTEWYKGEKNTDYTISNGELKSWANAGFLEWTDEDLAEATASKPEKEETPKNDVNIVPGEVVSDADAISKAPIGTSVVHKDSGNVYTKTGDNEWKTDFSGLTFDDIDFEPGVAAGAYIWTVKDKPSSQDAYTPGTKVNSIHELEKAPVGTSVSLNAAKYVKQDSGMWKIQSTSGAEYETELFSSAVENKKLTYSEPATPSTLSAPSTPTLPGKNGKNVGIGATVSYKTPQKNKTGKVVSIDTANGDVVFIDDATGKKAKHKAKFLSVTQEASDSSGTTSAKPAPVELPKDPSSPWFEKPEPVAPSQPEQMRTDFAIDGLLEEISENYKKEKNKDFTDSSYFHQYEQLSKNGSSKPTVQVNEMKYGPQKDLFDFFQKRGYISEETAAKARKHYEDVVKGNKTLNDQYQIDYDKYVQDLNDWKIANGIPLSSFNSQTYTLSDKDAILSMMKSGSQAGAKALDAIYPDKSEFTEKDLHAWSQWKGSGGSYGVKGSPDYLPYIDWSSLSSDLRSKGKKGYDDPSVLDPDHAIVVKAITEAIDKGEVSDDIVITRRGNAKNFVGPDGTPLSSFTDLKNLQGSILTDYGVFAASPGSHPGYSTMGNDLTIRVRVPKGAHVGWLGGKIGVNTGENEVILPPGSKFYLHHASGGEIVVDLVPEDWTPAAGQTTGAVNATKQDSGGGITVSPGGVAAGPAV